VVVALGAGSVGVPRGVLKLGHFAADRWTAGGADGGSAVAELFVGGEGLSRGAEGVLATLLHEATHGLAHVRRVQDTSRQGRYHNARFRALGEELGLAVAQAPVGSAGPTPPWPPAPWPSTPPSWPAWRPAPTAPRPESRS
jgi:hypothetical protein